MDSFLGNTRPYFLGLPTSTRGYDGATLEDQTHAPPTPTPPATPTLPPAHVYHPYQHAGVTGGVPATGLPGLLPPSRPITPATPSHKPTDHTQAASPYSVPSFLQPHPTKTSSNEARCVSQFEHVHQAAVTVSTRPSNQLHDTRTPTRPLSNQPSLIIDSRIPGRPYGSQSTVSSDSRTLPRPCTTQVPSSVELRPVRPYSTQPGIKADSRTLARPYSTQLAPTNDLRTYPHLFSSQTLASDPRSQLDNRYPPRNEVRSDLRNLETRSDPRADFRDQLYRVPEAKTLERLAPSVHISATPISVNGSKDALYLGKKSEDITSVRRSEDPYIRRSIETLQVNGSRDPLYPNGSHTYSSDTKRESSAERQADSRPKEDSALDLSVKTLRQTPDLTAPDPDKTFSISPLSGVTIERISQSDSLKCTRSSTPVTSPSKLSKDTSITHVDLLKVAPGISGTPRATPPHHIPSSYGINGSPSPLPSSSPHMRACHMLPATKRPGDPAYLENFTKLPRRSHTPPTTKPTAPSRQLAGAHLPIHPQDKSLYSGHKDSISEQNRGVHPLASATLKTEDDTRYGKEFATDRRQSVIDRKDSGNEWRDVSLERRVIRNPDLARRDVSFERKDPGLERRDPSLERRDASLERRDTVLERRDPNLDRRELSIEKWDLNSVMDSKYLHARHSDTFDPYRAWANASEQSKTNSDKVKYLPGQYPVPTSVPTTLPQQGPRVPPAQPPHPYSSYGRPPDTRLPQTPYSQSAHTVSPAHHPQVSVAHSTQGKIHQSYVQPATSRTSHASASHSNSHSSQPPVITSVTQSYHYPYTSSQAAAAHYHQQQQQQQQQRQRSAMQYTPFNIPSTTKSAGVVSLPPPHLTPQQAAHQAYIYAQQRNEASHALYPTKRSNQMSPHPSGSPHPSISPHPSASPHPTASPHPSASPHPVAASPRSGVSPHPSHQGRTPQLSPHPAQRLPTSSPAQHPSHNYPGSLPPSPYSGHQTYPPHSTSPSRPPSAMASHPHPSQPQPNHPSKSPAAHTSQPPSAHPSQPHLNRPTEPHPARLAQHMEAHPPQGHHSQAHTQHSLSSQNHHPQAHSHQSHHFQAASPQSHQSQARPSHSHSSQAHHHQNHPSQVHLPQPVISQANSHPSHPSSYPSQVHPYASQISPHPSQAPSQPSQAPPHPSQAPPHASQAPTHSSQAPTHSSQAPTHASQAPTHSSQAPTHSSQAPTHSSQAPTHSSQAPTHSSQAPTHSSQGPTHSSQGPTHSSQGPTHASQAPTHSSQPPTHSSQAPTHISQAPTHASQPSPHVSHIRQHPSQVPSYPSQAHPHPSRAPPNNSQAHPHPSQASSHSSQASLHPSQAPSLSFEAASHPYLAPPYFSQAPSHTSQATLHSSHAPPHPSHIPPHPQVPPHPSQASSHSSQAHSHPHQAPSHPSQAHPYLHSYPRVSQAPPQHSPALSHPSYVSHPSQALPHPSQAPPHPSQAPPHPSQAPPHPPQASPHSSHVSSHPSQAPTHPHQAPHTSPHPSHATSHSSHTSSHPTRASPHPSQVPPHPPQASHPSQAHPHPSQAPSHPSQAPTYAQAPPHPSQSFSHTSQTHPHPSLPHPSQATTQPSQTHSHPSHHIHPTHPHPSQPYPHPHPTQPYPHPHPTQPYHHPSQAHAHLNRAHSQPSQPQSPRAHLPHPHASQMRLPHQAQLGHHMYPSHQTAMQQTSQSHSSHSSHKHPSHPSQPHPPQGHPQHTQRIHYQPPRPPHPSVKIENVPVSSQYPGYMYPSSYAGARPDMGLARGQLDPTTQQPELSSTNPRIPQDHDLSRIRTKGEQKAFDPRSAESGESCVKLEPWSNCSPSVQGIHQPNHGNLTENLPYNDTKPPVQPLRGIDNQDGPKAAAVFEFREEDGNKLEQPQSAGKMLEPGKAALAEKLHKKIQRAESLESLVIKKENAPELSEAKKEEPSEENEWDFGLSRFMEDLAANPEGVTSKKSKTLGRRYLQKVQIQQAIDNDLIVPPPSDIIEEEDESEPEPPVKFRGKFKSIKDKKVERLILTYASHSDESATEMIPDEDASDFEEELKREIRSKDKKRGHSRKIAKGYISSGSEIERKDKKKGIARGRNKENKPNNKQDSDFSPSSSSSESDSSSSTSSDDSDSEDSELEEVVRPRRKGKKSSDSEEEEKPKRRGRKWDSDSTESEEEIIPRRRTRRGYKSSSEGEMYKTTQKNKKRKKKQDSSDSDDITMKIRRGKKKKWESDDEDEYIETRRGKKKGTTGRKQLKKSRKEDSEEDSETGEISRKTRGMKKIYLDSKKSKRRKQVTSISSSSDSDETNERKEKIFLKKKSNIDKIRKSAEDTSENSDIPTKKKGHSKSNLIVDSDDSDDLKNNDIEEKSTGEKQMDKEEGEEDESIEKNAKTTKEPDEEEKQKEEETVELDEGVDETELESDSVIEKLKKIRDEELNREDVREMTAWLTEVNSDIQKQVGNLQEMAFRHCWKKPQFGAGDDFLHGWQTDVKKYKELTGRFPKKLCQAVKHQVLASPTKGTPKKGRDRESGKDSPLTQQGSSSPAKNTRSKSGIIKTSMAVAEDDRLKVAARPEISSVMQRFFEKVLAETGSDCTKAGLASKKFNLGPFPAFGGQRIPTGLTPTPSVAPSMMASDDSDLDSLASLRLDLPASDSIPVSKRSIANSLLKKIGRKYKDKKLNSMCLNKTRSILEATNKPQLLPTPGMPTTEKDLEEMSPDQLKIATFFRKETVSNYRDNFEVIVTKNGINEFTPILYQSRTRNKTKQIQDAATVKSVFGTDIPPHLIKKAEAKKTKKPIKKAEKKDEVKTLVKDESSPVPVSRASTPGGSVLAQGDDDEDSELRSERSESVLGELSVPRAAKRVRRKFRKFRSGFDYIRKKKKVKPDDEATPSRKRLPVRRHVNWPEESRDVASEVRSWVVNKGLGETVLHKAARLQYHDVVVYCAESPDFDINVRDNAGYTPLHEACNRGHLDIAQVLCAHGAHVNAPGYKGMRPLHEAVENGHGELARLLLAYGADPALTTYAGQTCLALSADTQTTYLIEGYLADLKGRPGEMWHFGGPIKFLDPDEQGCDLFGNIPAGESVPSHQCLKSSDETDKQNSESQNEKTSDIRTACGDVAQKISKETLQSKSEKLSNCEESTLKINQNPSVVQMSEVQDLIKTEEISTENKTENNKESPKEASEEKYTPTNEERIECDITVKEENQDSDYEEKWDSKIIAFESSELPLLDVFQVDGRPHKYCLMLELLTLLKMTQAEFIISARTIETLELSLEEFESRAHSCILGSCSRAIVDTCSCVVLVRVTPTVEKLLGIETVKL